MVTLPPNLSFDSVRLKFDKLVPADPVRGLSPFYHFKIIAAGSEVGHINFRIGSSDHILRYAGHVGYEVLEPFRGRRYAFQACRALAPFVRSVYASVIITADPDNRPSLRTIERLGAIFLDEVAVPEHDPTYQSGSRSKRRYQWAP